MPAGAPAPALVLLPGMDGSSDLFAAFVAALGDAVTPLVVSYPADQVLGYEGLVDFARTRLPAGQAWVLLGESFSGPVAIALAAERPPGLCGMILSGTFRGIDIPVLYLQAAHDRVVGRAAARHIEWLLHSVKVVELRGPHLRLQAAPLDAATAVRQFVNQSVAVAGPV